MRLWTLHPQHLDRQGLTALWREALLAQAVLAGRTKGYRHHPQLDRFQATDDPLGTLASYLDEVRAEATRRGYSYDATRIDNVPRARVTLPATTGQVALEHAHLAAKLARRSPDDAARLPASADDIALHPLFTLVDGPVAHWERAVMPAQTAPETQPPQEKP